MTNFKEYPIYKKRDGQSFKEVSYIFADSFENAKKQFAKNMTNDNWEKSNNIVWLDKENDGVEKTGWYDLDCSVLHGNDEGEINYSESKMELFCSEDAINEGFDSWSEDVYTWELRDFIKEKESFEDEIKNSLIAYLENLDYEFNDSYIIEELKDRIEIRRCESQDFRYSIYFNSVNKAMYEKGIMDFDIIDTSC